MFYSVKKGLTCRKDTRQESSLDSQNLLNKDLMLDIAKEQTMPWNLERLLEK
jgi:hypothetical protein